jgi:hypothetical protein
VDLRIAQRTTQKKSTMNPVRKRLYSLEEAAQYLGRSNRTWVN